MFTPRQQDALALLSILVVSLLFRTWQLDRFPPGLFGDEAVNGLDALDVLAGRPQLFFPANFGREGLHMLVLAPFIGFLGPTGLALRLPSAVAGVLTALGTYWLGRELLARTRISGPLVPLIAALFLATSYWHVHFSRFGIRGVFTPLMATLAFAAFWRGANAVAATGPGGSRRALPWLLLSGLFLGLGVHFYTASRLIPIFLGLFLLLQAGYAWWLSRHPRPSRSSTHPSLLRRAFWPLAGLYGVALLVFAPLGLYFLRTPGSLTQRADAVSLFNPEITGDNPLTRLGAAATANLLQFFVPGAGDQATFYNLPGRPVFDLLTAVLALVGLVVAVVALSRGSSPHLFLLLWFPAMLVPTFLAVDRFPTLPRALGVLPGIYFFPALGLGLLVERLGRWRPPRSLASPTAYQQSSPRTTSRLALLTMALLVGVPLAIHGWLTWRDYFTRWGPAQATFEAFEGDVAAAAGWLAQYPAQEVYLSLDIYRHPTFVYLHEQVPLAEFFQYLNPLVHQFDGRGSLPLPPPGQSATYLYTYNAGPDPVLHDLPSWPGFASRQEIPGPRQPALTIAQLDWDNQAPGTGETFFPADIAFTPNLRLIGYQLLPLEADRIAALLLWHVQGPEPGNYAGLQVQAGLTVPGQDQQLTQASVELTYRPTEWAADGRALSWVQLTLPPAMPEVEGLALRLIDLGSGLPLDALQAKAEGWVVLPAKIP